MKQLALIVLGVALCATCVHAQEDTQTLTPLTPPILPQNALSVSDQKAWNSALDLVRVTGLWDTTLDWKGRDATTTDWVAYISKALGKEAPTIEVRGQDTTRTTFTLPKAPLGPTLTALAEISNYNVWVFPGKLVLAPESALTDEEREAVKQRSSGEWRLSSGRDPGSSWDSSKPLTTIALAVVGPDIKARLAAKGHTGPAPRDTQNPSPDYLPYEIPFNDLGATSQMIIERLVCVRNGNYSPSVTPFPVDPSTVVGYSADTSSQNLELRKYDNQGPKPFKRIGQWSISFPIKPPIP